MSDEISSYNVPAYITEEESVVIAMLAKKMLCPICDAPATVQLKVSAIAKKFDRPMSQVPLGPGAKDCIKTYKTPRAMTWNCTNSHCDQSKGN